MNLRLEYAQSQHYLQSWTTAYAKHQWTYISHLLELSPTSWARQMARYPSEAISDPHAIYDPFRHPGRPRLKWDHYIEKFCYYLYPDTHEHWIDILSIENLIGLSESYINFVSSST